MEMMNRSWKRRNWIAAHRRRRIGGCSCAGGKRCPIRANVVICNSSGAKARPCEAGADKDGKGEEKKKEGQTCALTCYLMSLNQILLVRLIM